MITLMKTLPICEFGNPILRKKAKALTPDEIKSTAVQELIANMRHTLVSKKLGIALAAPQVNESLALAVIAIRPTAHRPNVEPFDLIIINPEITKTYGARKQLWEGCISSGVGEANLFAKVPRYNKIDVRFLDEAGIEQTKTFDGLVAQAVQHETDHLNGILFVDHVEDPTTYMTMKEYRQRITKV